MLIRRTDIVGEPFIRQIDKVDDPSLDKPHQTNQHSRQTVVGETTLGEP